MAGEFAGKAKFGMADVQKSKIHENYDVNALPTTIILKEGKVSGTVVGPDAGAVEAKLRAAL